MALTEADPRAGTEARARRRTASGGSAGRAGAPRPVPAVATPTRTPRGGHLPYFPSLDGLRGVAVIAVLLFHGGFTWATGGYLGVSTFFTLSGFLITSLLLAERGATHHIDLRAFWIRRIRRLMPAAFAAVGLAVLFALVAADAAQRRNIGGDALGALGYVANWRFVLTGQSYAAQFANESPLLHFWSLAIEEQFYLFYPFVVYLVLRVLRWSRDGFAAVLVALLALSVAAPLLLGYSQDRFYFGTDARAAELLAGCLLAVALYYPRVTRRLAHDGRSQRGIAAVSMVALLGCVALWTSVAKDTDLLYRGGFLAYAGLSVLVIVGAVLPSGPVAWVLGRQPLVWIGRISYGLYLYHFPVFLWVDERTTGWGPWPTFALRIAISLILAVASYRFLELPIRRGAPLLPRLAAAVRRPGSSQRGDGIAELTGFRPSRLAALMAVTLGCLALVVAATAPKPDIALDDADAEAFLEGAAREAPPPPSFDPASAVPPRPRISMFGDSTALNAAFGLQRNLKESGKGDFVPGVAELGCSIMRGTYKMDIAGIGGNAVKCDHWDQTWKDAIDKYQPNVAVVQVGPWEVVDHKFERESTYRSLGDPVFDDRLRAEMLGVTDVLSSRGAEVIWVTLPPMGAPPGKDPIKFRGQGADPARAKRYNELVNELPAARPGKVRVIDIAGWLVRSGDDTRLRPDGVHLSIEGANEFAQRFFTDAIIGAFNEDWVNRKRIEFERQQATGQAPTEGSSPVPASRPTGSAPPAPAGSGTAPPPSRR